MTNKDLIKNFIEGHVKGTGTNLEIRGSILLNYGEPIACRSGRYILLNGDKYSSGVTRNQNIIRKQAYKIIECPEHKFFMLSRDNNKLQEVINAFNSIMDLKLMVIR